MSYFILMGRRIPKQAITGFKFQNETDNIRPFLSIRIRGKEEIIPFKDKREILSVKAHLCSVFSKFVKIGDLLVKYNAFKIESRFLTGSYEQFWIIKESVCPAVKGEAGYSKEEFDKVNKESKDPELESINSFNDTVKKANEIKDRVLKYVYNIKQERSYNNDLVGIFERYKDIADGDMEVAMNFIKEAYPFNEETESFIRKKFDMPIPDESKEQ